MAKDRRSYTIRSNKEIQWAGKYTNKTSFGMLDLCPELRLLKVRDKYSSKIHSSKDIEWADNNANRTSFDMLPLCLEFQVLMAKDRCSYMIRSSKDTQLLGKYTNRISLEDLFLGFLESKESHMYLDKTHSSKDIERTRNNANKTLLEGMCLEFQGLMAKDRR